MLYDNEGVWLGQVVITEDGMFAAVTDYGNFSYTWRSFGKGDFRDFLQSLNTGYFATKMAQGLAYIVHSKNSIFIFIFSFLTNFYMIYDVFTSLSTLNLATSSTHIVFKALSQIGSLNFLPKINSMGLSLFIFLLSSRTVPSS